MITVAGVLVSAYWIKAIESYKTLNTAKFQVINEIERDLVIKPFTEEWRHLDPGGAGAKHRPFHQVEKIVPKIFMLVYLLQLASIIPWSRLIIYLMLKTGGNGR